MTSARVTVDPSRFPTSVQQVLLESLRGRQIDHQFHYQSVKQAQQWISLHEQYAPSEVDRDCANIYSAAYARLFEEIHAQPSIHVIGLGCGAGEKESSLLHALEPFPGEIQYTPCDVSLPLALTSFQAASQLLRPEQCHPVISDLLRSESLPEILNQLAGPDVPRVFTFFGLLPNFEPADVSTILLRLLRPNDFLLLSANLSPGPNYHAGVQKVLAGYDNPATRDWLSTFLWDAGFERGDGQVQFAIETPPNRGGLQRINGNFHLTAARTFDIGLERFRFQPGEKIRLFFSYRHQPDNVKTWLENQRLHVLDHWTAPSAEEAVFLCQLDPLPLR